MDNYGLTMGSLPSALEDFRRARRQADLKELLGRIRGESTQLLSYDEVRQKLKMLGSSELGLRDIPLDAIVGSVGRYTDFTRDFLPRREVNPERWARVKLAASRLVGLPPIDVYQIGDVYFVQDGNHRVSVARQLGATHIQAYVTEVHTRVPLTPDIQIDDLILKAEYDSFLEQTQLDKLRPGADLSVSIPGQYPILLEHIAVHRYYMGLDFKRDISYPEAVAHWYDAVYLPVVEVIRNQCILRHFPGRTETDLYLWIAEHRAHLEEQLGWQINTEHTVSDLVSQFGAASENILSRIGGKILEIILPEQLEPEPPVGQWRFETLAAHSEDHMFQEILVPISGGKEGWYALEQALLVARREGAQLLGLHVVPTEEEKGSTMALEVQAEFERRCKEAELNGKLVVAAGEVANQIILHSRIADLVITNLAYPPTSQPLARLGSGFRDLIVHCPRPILATPQVLSPLGSALLAYDSSPKAQEALFIATYLASQWHIPLVVASVQDGGHINEQTLERAKEYLEAHKVQARYALLQAGPVGEALLEASDIYSCDFLVMGGYGLNPILEVVFGSSVDQVLRESCKPMLICR
jgi:nucleotide-binding universal stress UspA family protein